MRRHREKKPWNPFPLASLKVEGLSACAKSVLIYLAARSDYKGQTCVGHRTMCRELVRSKDFVTRGLQELREKGLLREDSRVRHKNQADWRVLSSEILKSRTIHAPSSSPEGQDHSERGNPAGQEFDNPDRQGETLQIKQELNLAGSNPEPTDQNLEVRKSVSEAPPVLADEAKQSWMDLESPTGSHSPARPKAENQNPPESNGLEEPMPEFGADGQADWDYINSEVHPDFTLPRSGQPIDGEGWHVALTYYMQCFKVSPRDMQKPCHGRESVLAFAECALDLESRCPLKSYSFVCSTTGIWQRGISPDIGDRHPIRDLVYWNRTHKTGGLQWSCGTDLATAYWSDSAKSALAQFQSHDPETCVKCRR
jgi:hypothetical protein